MSSEETTEVVRRFIVASFWGEGVSAPGDDDDLFALLDSLQVLRLVGWIEEHFGVQVGDADLTADNFGTIGRVAAFVRKKGPGRSLP